MHACMSLRRYESADLAPLLRVCWNQLDTNLLATVTSEGHVISVIDIRY